MTKGQYNRMTKVAKSCQMLPKVVKNGIGNKSCQTLLKDMMTWWYDDMMTWWHDDTITWWYDDTMTRWHYGTMTRWHDDTMTGWHDDTMTRWHDDMMTGWHDDMMTWSLSNVTYNSKIVVVHCTQNWQILVWPIYQAQWWKWKIIITQCNLPLPNYGRPLHQKLPPTRMTYIPSSMIKMTTDFVEKSSLSSVTYHRQITVVHCTQNCHLLVWPIC